jgi:dihydroflavonol-4-reductase
VGANLTRALLKEGRRVRVTIYGEDTRAVEGLPVERVEADVLKPDSLRHAFDKAEVVYHLAAVLPETGLKRSRLCQVNVEGVRNAAEACLACGVRRMVHFSSVHALSHRPVSVPVDETRPRASGRDVPEYDRSKADGERELMAVVEKGLDAVIVSPTGIIGPNDFEPSLMGRFLTRLFRGELPALVDGGFDWVDVRDVVRGAISVEKIGRTGERYLLGGRWTTVAELAKVAEAVTGVKAPRFLSPMWLARIGSPFAVVFGRLLGRRSVYTGSSLKALRRHRRVSHEKAARELGYSARPLKETIEAAYRWYREAGMM